MSRTLFITTAALALAAQPVRADVTLPAVFGDGMVLQTSPAVPVWGRAAPGERVTVAFAGRSATAAADPAGRWRLTLDLTPRPTAPADLTVVGDRTAAPRVFRDVAVGEVWLASGQSNMEKPVGPHPGQHPVDDWEKEVAGSADPGVRVFTVAKKASDRPLDDCGGRWEAASPATTARFTAAGYFFARELHRELRVPVGIIHASWGGTRAEAWTSPDGLAADPALAAPARAEADAYRNYPRALQQYRADVARWARANGCDDPEKVGHAVPAATEGWQPVALGAGKKGSVPAGVRWYRKDVAVPARWQGQAAFLVLGVVAGFDTAYVNGTRVGGVGPDRAEAVGSLRQYLVPAGLLKPGANTIAVRVHSHLPADAPVAQAWRVALAGKGPKVDLGGPWLARTEKTFPPPGEAAVRAYPPAPPAVRHFDTAGFLFNGMIHPVIPYRLAGVIWYQGESNAAAPAGYGRAFPALINDWRSRWAAAGGAGGFPFYYCQLANYGGKAGRPAESGWAEVREAQRLTLDRVPNTGMAVLIDAGQAKDIHPTDKQTVGRRLALLALARTYGREGEDSGPLYQSLTIEGNAARVRFSHAAGGLVAKPLPAAYRPQTYLPATVPLALPRPGSPLQGFAVCGDDGKYVWADARIDGEAVVVSAAEVPVPKAVRYAWADNPTCNLYNAAGLPASPFGTAAPAAGGK